MFDCFLTQILVLLMLFLCSARIFFIKKARVDAFTAFAPISVFISICILFCFDFSILNFSVFVLSIVVFLINFRAVLRLGAMLIVDSYGVAFIIFSILSLLLIILLSVAVIITRPVKYSAKEFGITKKEFTLTGSLQNLSVRESYFTGEKFSGNMCIYEPKTTDDITKSVYSENPLLIFATGIRSNIINYEPYFMIMAQKGYTVLAADLYTDELRLLSKNTKGDFKKRLVESKFFRRFAAIHAAASKPDEFKDILLEEKKLSTQKYSALTKLALEIFGDEISVFYITDGVDFDSIYTVIDEFNTEPYSNAKGFFSMNRIDEYKTSGYGFIEQTDVFLSYGMKIERENKFFIPRYIANKTIKAIGEQK